MQPERESPGQLPPTEQVAAEVKSLQQLLNEIPQPVLLERFREDLNWDPSATLAVEVSDNLDKLFTLAQAADPVAIQALVTLGLKITKQLTLFAASQEEDSPISLGESGDEQAAGNTRAISALIERLSAMKTAVLEEIEQGLERITDAGLNLSAAVITNETAFSVGELEREANAKDQSVSDREPRMIVESIVDLLVSRRLLKLARSTAREIAANTLSWPNCCPPPGPPALAVNRRWRHKRHTAATYDAYDSVVVGLPLTIPEGRTETEYSVVKKRFRSRFLWIGTAANAMVGACTFTYYLHDRPKSRFLLKNQ